MTKIKAKNRKRAPAVAVQRVVSRRRTGYNDKNGNPIREGDTVRTWMSAPWDEQVPIERTFKVEREPGVGWMCKGEKSNDEDDLLKHFRHLEIQKAKPANDGTQRPGDAEATNATRATPPGSLE